jgi:hypothetical protein
MDKRPLRLRHRQRSPDQHCPAGTDVMTAGHCFLQHHRFRDWLAAEIQRRTLAKTRGSHPRVTFREAAAKYLKDNRDRIASIEDAAWHVALVEPWIGGRALEEVHDGTLEPFVEHRLKIDKVSLTTVNRSKEIVRRVLNLAARKWRHENGMTWLETAPLISVEAKLAKRVSPIPSRGTKRICY